MPAPTDRVRVAVAQLASHPAYVVEGRALIAEPLGTDKGAAVLPLEAPAAVAGELSALRSRCREQYLGQLTSKVLAVLAWCRTHSVNILVFPEYSLPAEVLEAIAREAGPTAVVAGSHLVELAGLKSGIYERLGVTQLPKLGNAVSPILVDGRIRQLVAKLTSSPKGNEQSVLRPGERWAPVQLPEILPGALGVLLCIDFVNNEAPPILATMAQRQDVSLWAVVARTGKYSSQTDFFAEARKQSTRPERKRPVLYANDAGGGGSGVFADSRTPTSFLPSTLPSGEEGLIVAEIDLRRYPPGESASYASVPSLRIVATPSLVYPARVDDAEYSSWLEASTRGLEAARGDEPAALEFASRHADALRGVLDRPMPSTRRRRLQRFLNTASTLQSIDELTALLADIVLPVDVLPLDDLEGALALGAAAVIRGWVETEMSASGASGGSRSLSPLSEAEQALAACGASARRPARWAETGRRAMREIESRVRGHARPLGGMSDLEVQVDFYRGYCDQLSASFRERLLESFQRGDYDAVRAESSRLLDDALARLAADPGSNVRRQADQLRLLLAVALLNLQQISESRRYLFEIDLDGSDIESRLNWVRLAAELGEPREAIRVLDETRATSAAPDPITAKAFREAEQILSLCQGSIPEQLEEDLGIRLKAAQLELQRGRLERAVALALEVDDPAPLPRCLVLLVLTVAIGQTIVGWPGTEPLSVVRRRHVIDAIERSTAKGLPGQLPAPLRDKLTSVYHEYLLNVHDLDRLERDPSREADVSIFESARKGDLQGALESLGQSNDMQMRWAWEINRVQLELAAGERGQALEHLLRLIEQYPEIGPIRLQLALVQVDRGHPEAALEQAKKAAELVPALGYRLVLAYCLSAAQRPNDAWSVLEADRASRRPRVLAMLAQLAEQVKPAEAPALWREYAECTNGVARGRALLAEAKAWFALTDRSEAATRAWVCFEQFGDQLDARGLFECAQLVRTTNQPLALIHRTRAIARTLNRRFPNDAEAQGYWLQLHVQLGPDDDEEPNFEHLEALGVVQPLPSDEIAGEAAAAFVDTAELSNACWSLYETGVLPLHGVGNARSRSLAEVVSEMFDTNRLFCAPIPVGAQGLEALTGQELLLGDTELLILARLHLLEPLRAAARSSGASVLICVETREQLFEQAARLRGQPAGELASWALEFSSADMTVHLATWNELRDGLGQVLPEVPELKPNADNLPELYREPLVDGLRVAGAVLASPRRWVVAADFAALRLNADMVRQLRWRSREELSLVNQVLTRARQRIVSIPHLVRIILYGSSHQGWRPRQILRKLARRGFTDALKSDELLNLARDAPDLSQHEYLLDGVEHQARSSERGLGDAARSHVAMLYGRTLFGAFVGSPVSSGGARARAAILDVASPKQIGEAGVADTPTLPLTQARVLATAVLTRLERLGEEAYGVLDAGLSMVAALSADALAGATKPSRDSGMSVVSAESPVGLLWQHLSTWAGPEGSRQVSLMRALRNAWCWVDGRAGAHGPTIGQQGPLVLAQHIATGRVAAALSPEGQRGGSGGDPVGAENSAATGDLPSILHREAEAILSSNWQVRPLALDGLTFGSHGETVVSWEQILERGARDLAELARAGPDLAAPRTSPRRLEVWYPLGDSDRFRAVVPIEAALLRSSSSDVGVAAHWVQRLQGGRDGRAHRLLENLRLGTADEQEKRHYARQSVTALWRLVQDDPAYLAIWSRSVPGASPESRPSWRYLCELLHEPINTLPADITHADVVSARAEWAAANLDPYVAGDLLLQWTEAPGAVASLPLIWQLLLRDPSHEVEQALSRIEDSDSWPAAALGRDVMLLRVALQRHPVIDLSRGRVDLRQVLPVRFEQLIERLCRGGVNARGPMAEHEPALLRVCASVIRDLSAGVGGRSRRDGIWLTYRLYAWLTLQLGELDPSARRAGVERLARVAPSSYRAPIEDAAEIDLFDPFVFEARGFDYRLAVVLFAWIASDELARRQPAEPGEPIEIDHRSLVAGVGAKDAISPGPPLSTPGLEKLLLELYASEAASKSSASAGATTWFAWAAPDNVSDLALLALLKTNPARLLELGSSGLFSMIERWPARLSDLLSWQVELLRGELVALTRQVQRLDPSIRNLLEQRLLAFGESELERSFRLLGFASLFSAGAAHLEAQLLPLLDGALDMEGGERPLAQYLLGVFLRGSERVQFEVQRLYERWQGMPRAVEILSDALALLIVHEVNGARDRASQSLRWLAERSELKGHAQLDALLRYLRLDSSQA